MRSAGTFRAVRNVSTERARRMVGEHNACWRRQLVPALASQGIRFLKFNELDTTARQWVELFYRTEVLPVLSGTVRTGYQARAFEDAARPAGESLSVTPPLSFGAARAKT